MISMMQRTVSAASAWLVFRFVRRCERVRGAHAPRVLIAAPRRNELGRKVRGGGGAIGPSRTGDCVRGGRAPQKSLR